MMPEKSHVECFRTVRRHQCRDKKRFKKKTDFVCSSQVKI